MMKHWQYAIPTVDTFRNDDLKQTFPPQCLALELTGKIDGFPVKVSIRETDDGRLQIMCDGGSASGMVVLTNFTGNGFTLSVDTNDRSPLSVDEVER